MLHDCKVITKGCAACPAVDAVLVKTISCRLVPVVHKFILVLTARKPIRVYRQSMLSFTMNLSFCASENENHQIF